MAVRFRWREQISALAVGLVALELEIQMFRWYFYHFVSESALPNAQNVLVLEHYR